MLIFFEYNLFKLGPVDNHLESISAATRFQQAAWLQSVLSYLVAIALNSLIFAKSFSTKWRHF